MSKTYRAWNPDQDWLLPPSPREWLPEGDLVYFLLDMVKTFDLSAITRQYEQEGRGYPPFHPRMMVIPARRDCCTATAWGRTLPAASRSSASVMPPIG